MFVYHYHVIIPIHTYNITHLSNFKNLNIIPLIEDDPFRWMKIYLTGKAYEITHIIQINLFSNQIISKKLIKNIRKEVSNVYPMIIFDNKCGLVMN